MTAIQKREINNKDFQFVIERVLDAPRDLVWKVWTDEAHLARWFGPKGCPIFSSKLDFKVGGTYHYGMRMPNGDEMWGKWTFRDIEAPEKFTHLSSFSDPDGNIATHPMAPDWPREILATASFKEQDGKTLVTLIWQAYNATDIERKTFEEGKNSMRNGWSGTFEQLETYLAEIQ